LLLIPIEGGGTPGASRTAAYLLVPRATERYRIDVAGGEPPIRVRVETDPREMSRWARMQQETKDLPMAGLSLRGGYLGPFVRPRAAGVPPTGTASAAGVEACFAAETGLARLQRLGDGLEPDGQANVVPHFGLGLQLRF